MYENNEDLEFFYPEEGTNLYIDAMCIPKTSKNQALAESYINFMLMVDEDFDEGFLNYMEDLGEDFYSPAIANAEYTYYASPNQKVVDDEGYRDCMNEIKDDAYEKMYGTEDIKTTAYKNLSGERLAMINSLWEDLKSDITVSPTIYIICISIVGTLVFCGVFFAVRRKKRDNF